MLKKKILIVDDEEHILELIKFNLEKNGFEVLSSDNGEDCISILESNSVDLLVLDLMLPGMDGIDVCKEIRKIDKFNK